MAQFETGSVNNQATKAAFSQREDLANFISNIVRDDIPFSSSIGKGKATAILHEWSTDTLATPKLNVHAEGAAFSDGDAVNTPVVKRLGNYSQIFRTEVEVAGSMEVVSKAGRKSEFKYQSEKRGKELMRDLEYALVASRGVSNGAQAGRTFGGYQSWAPASNTIDTVLATATNVTDGDGDGKNITVFNATNVGTGVFSLSSVDEVMQTVWQNGGKPTTLMMSPAKKRSFSVAAQGQTNVSGETANVRRNIDDKGKLTQSVTLYESDFGLVKVVPNYIMAATGVGSGATLIASHKDSDILVYDSASFKMATLRPLHHRDISEDGDRLRSLMVHETTLECMNPAAVGLIGNLKD